VPSKHRWGREWRTESCRIEEINERAVCVDIACLVDDTVTRKAAVIGAKQKGMGDSQGFEMTGQIGRHVVVPNRVDHVIDADSDAHAAGCRCAGDNRAASQLEREQAGTVDIDVTENEPLLDRPVVVEPVHPAQRGEIGRLLRRRKAAVVIDARIGADENTVECRQESVILAEKG